MKDKYGGFLVLLPNLRLIDTWKEEIKKHMKEEENFDILTQKANGQLEPTSKIGKKTILLTTLGRMRDHPISQSWIIVTIDECLSVQNNSALQTEESWKQILSSQYGVLMMSATFFRSRFDKLFYMLKMLRSGLPEKSEYLDTILNEHMICKISNGAKKWKVDIKRGQMNDKLREKYEKIQISNLSSEDKYGKLLKLLSENYDYVKLFGEVVKEMNDNGNKCLIYTKSKKEALEISNKYKNIGLYPNINDENVVVSYSDGTYGLNNLIKYNTIITRPPHPDFLPQMKGRLDRPNNKHEEFNIKYVIIENSIEEAQLMRIDLCQNFYKNHIMPLAEFYDLANGIKNEIKNEK